MKTLEQLAKEFVCNVGCEPTEKQEYEIKGLVMFAKAAFKECQLTPGVVDGAYFEHEHFYYPVKAGGPLRCVVCNAPRR